MEKFTFANYVWPWRQILHNYIFYSSTMYRLAQKSCWLGFRELLWFVLRGSKFLRYEMVEIDIGNASINSKLPRNALRSYVRRMCKALSTVACWLIVTFSLMLLNFSGLLSKLKSLTKMLSCLQTLVHAGKKVINRIQTSTHVLTLYRLGGVLSGCQSQVSRSSAKNHTSHRGHQEVDVTHYEKSD